MCVYRRRAVAKILKFSIRPGYSETTLSLKLTLSPQEEEEEDEEKKKKRKHNSQNRRSNDMGSVSDRTRCHAIAGRTARCRYKFRHNGIVHAVTVVQHGFLV